MTFREQRIDPQSDVYDFFVGADLVAEIYPFDRDNDVWRIHWYQIGVFEEVKSLEKAKRLVKKKYQQSQ